ADAAFATAKRDQVPNLAKGLVATSVAEGVMSQVQGYGSAWTWADVKEAAREMFLDLGAKELPEHGSSDWKEAAREMFKDLGAKEVPTSSSSDNQGTGDPSDDNGDPDKPHGDSYPVPDDLGSRAGANHGTGEVGGESLGSHAIKV